ncbi:MAG: prolyl oligopeptidase family serine peptidase [Ferruginibacter sp.]
MNKIFLPFAGIILLASCNNKNATEKEAVKAIAVKYPETRKDTSVNDDYFGEKVTDPYRWLENDTSAETGQWVKDENNVTRKFLEQIPYREDIRKRYQQLFNYEKFSAPAREGKYNYYSKNTGLQNQYVMYRELITGSEPEIFLDPNTFSSDGTTSLSGINFSKDGSLAAYNISEGGSDWQKIIVMDAEAKKQLGDTMMDIKFGSASWKGNEGFYYSTYDRPKEGSFLQGKTDRHKLFFHKMGTPQKDDQLIFGGEGPAIRYVGGNVSEDQRWLFILAATETYGNSLYVQDLSKPGAPIVAMVSDMKSQNGVIDTDAANFYIQTDRNAPNGKIMIVPFTDPAETNWKVLVDAKPEVLSTSVAGGYIYCSYLKDAITEVYQYDKKGKQLRKIDLPGPGTAGGFSGKTDDKDVFFYFASYIIPSTIYKMNIESGKSQIYKQPKVEFNPADYVSEQVFYPSKDGTKVPMILTYKKGLEMNGKNPCLLYGYGGFNISLTPYFNTSSIILLENGGIYAVANIRGGGEYGQSWHEQGIKLKKQNVFDDFMAAAQYLKDKKYTSSEKLAIEGGSNGGLLVGACITQKPDICKVAFPGVGVLDMLRYHKFTSGAGWAYDYGTSADNKEMFDYLHKYSPVHNVKAAAYPATMVTTADHDDRVVPAHSFKFAAELQDKQTGPNPVLIRIETKAGHGAGKSTEQIIAEQTDKWSFMFYNMEVTPKYNNNKLK